MALAAALVNGCSGSSAGIDPLDASADGRGGENVGQACTSASQCFATLDGAALQGEAKCLDRVTGGYCTHLCQTDANCCAVPGECSTGSKQVCAPFESSGQNMCFLSCEKEDLRPAADGGVLDENAYCQTYAGSDFSCRSTGGGKNNRKVCVPGGSATTTSDAGKD